MAATMADRSRPSSPDGSPLLAGGLDALVAELRTDRRFVHVERIPARTARFGDLARPLPREIQDRLGVTRLWTHQAAAIDLARAGTSVSVATGTASGKSLCYQVPIAEAVNRTIRPGTALAMFPTKALAQDQLRSLGTLDIPGMTAATYDGDTDPGTRTWIRANANVILTNPEMLHVGVLPHHARWGPFLRRLEFVVVDELHTLRGIFGSHVAHVLRRLRRVCAHYGSHPTFVFSSATIGQPEQLASDLCGLPVQAVTDDGSPRGERIFVLWNPQAEPESDPEPQATRMRSAASAEPAGAASARPTSTRPTSANQDTARLTAALVTAGHRTIAFCRSRKGTELVAGDVRRRLSESAATSIASYRGGYLASERREIEARIADGTVRGVIATSALELGVDIGGLDACVINGFPGTVASLWQQAGRAGRATETSVAALVAGEDQLDQWFMAHPTELFTRPPEPAVINAANPFVALPHLACAAYELPLRARDEQWWSPDVLGDSIRDLVQLDALKVRPSLADRGTGTGTGTDESVAYYAARGWPSSGVGLRSTGGSEFSIALDSGDLVGTVDAARAFNLVHPGAIYLHQGQTYRVRELHVEDRYAIVEPHDGSEYTQPRSETDIELIEAEQQRTVGRSGLYLGRVRVHSRVIGYKRFDRFTGSLVGHEELFLPPSDLETRAFWYTVPDTLLAAAGVDPLDVPGTLHAVEHAAIGMMPLFAICDRWDVGGVSTPFLPETGMPTIVVYDGYPGGAGVAELGYQAADRHLDATREVIAACPCDAGCPSCVQSPKCGNGNEPLDKSGAQRLLDALLGTGRTEVTARRAS